MDLIGKDKIVKSPFTSISYPRCDLWEFYKKSFIQNGHKVALVDPDEDRTITFKDVQEKAEIIATNLLEHGYRSDTCLTICMSNCIELVLTVLGVWRIGGTVALINHLLTNREIKKALILLESDTVVCDNTTLNNVIQGSTGTNVKKIFTKDCEEPGCIPYLNLLNIQLKHIPPPPPKVDPEKRTAVILFSSGTTGDPKAVELTHSAIVQQNTYTGHTIAMKALNGGSIMYQPLSHVYGLVVTFLFILWGRPNVIMKKFHLEKYIALVAKHKVELLFLVPPTAVRFTKSGLAKKFNLSHIKVISVGGAPLGMEAADELKQVLGGHVNIIQGYGMTEAASGFMRVPPYDIGIHSPHGSVGWPMPNTFAKIMDLTSKENLGPNKNGEICIQCNYKMKGYFKNQAATAVTIDKDGWLHTGDIGYYDQNGCFFVVDRLKELIKYKGYQVSPSELEDLLLTHPSVADAGVASIPDDEAGELPVACIQLKPNRKNTTTSDIHKFVNERVAPYKRLRGGIKFVEAVPKSLSGKILRKAIKEISFVNITNSKL